MLEMKAKSMIVDRIESKDRGNSTPALNLWGSEVLLPASKPVRNLAQLARNSAKAFKIKRRETCQPFL